MISKLELKKELKGLGINVVKGNYIRKSDAIKILKSKGKKETKGNMADRFRQKTQTDKPHDEAKLDYLEEGKKYPVKGPADWADETDETDETEDDDLIL